MLSASKHTQHPSSTVKERMCGTDLPNFEFAMTTHRVTYTDSSSTSPRHVCTQTVRQFDYPREVARGSASVRSTQASPQGLSQSFVLGLVPPEIAFLLPSFKFVKLLFHNLGSQRTTPRRGPVFCTTLPLYDLAKFSPSTPAHPPALLDPPTPTPLFLSFSSLSTFATISIFLAHFVVFAAAAASLSHNFPHPRPPPPSSATSALVLLETSQPFPDN